MAYGIFRSDLMAATQNPAYIANVRYSPSATDTLIENGAAVLLGALDTDEVNVFVGATPARDSSLSDIVVVCTPEVMADERLKNLNQFYNVAGAISRGFHLKTGDMFAVTADVLTNSTSTTMAIGHVVELQAGTDWKVVVSLTSGSTQVGTIIAIEDDYYVIKVV